MKKTLITLLSIVLVIAALSVSFILGKNQIIKTVLKFGTSHVLGAPVTVKHVSSNLRKGKLKIDGLNIYNPEGFPKQTLAELPEISFELDTDMLKRGRLHFKHISIDLRKLTVIKLQNGETNISSLKLAQDTQSEKSQQEGKESATDEETNDTVKIDAVTLTVGKVYFKDYSKGIDKKPAEKTYDININERTFEGIPSMKQLIMIVISQTLAKTTIEGVMTIGMLSLGPTGGGLFIAKKLLGKMGDNNSARAKFTHKYGQVYDSCIAVAENEGKITKSNKESGKIKYTYEQTETIINLKKDDANHVNVAVISINAGEPDPETAKDVISLISEKLQNQDTP